MRILTKVRCKFGFHPQLQIIQTYGAAQHIGCPDCGREMAIHHGIRAALPWDSEIAQLYIDTGYDVAGATAAWHRKKTPQTPLASDGEGFSDGEMPTEHKDLEPES